MTIKLRFGVFLLSCLSSLAVASDQPWQSIGAVSQVRKLPNGVELTAGKSAVRVVAVTDSVIRVRVAQSGSFPDDHSWAILPEALPKPPTVRIVDSPKSVVFSVASGAVRIEKSPLRIQFLDEAGKLLQADSRPMAFSGSSFRVWKQMPADEHYYGLGDKAGPIDRRDEAFTMWNTDMYGWQESTDPLYKDIPFFLALRKGVAYGVFLDNAFRSSFDLGRGERDRYSFGAEGGELNYYFFFG